MGLRIAHNIAAMNAHRWLTISSAGLDKSLERLSSGYRINRAADDAAGLAISQTFRAEISSLKVASRNASEATAALQVAEGAVDQISNILVRLKELATQAASANAGNDRDKIAAEATELMTQIDILATSTEYAGESMLDGSYIAAEFQVGANNASDNRVSVTIGDFRTSAINGGFTVDLTTAASAQTAMDDISGAIDYVNAQRGNIGAYQNRLDYVAANIATMVENKQAAESVIRDVDMAAEMTTFTKNQILVQSGTAMLGQANISPQVVLTLLS